MCGICGVHNFKTHAPVDRSRLEQMNTTLTHRGPDGQGVGVDGEGALAMRRLSIIDLEHGQQPIWNEDQTAAVVCNGEIYNYRDATRALEARGHVFRTHSDVECIVHAYEEYGLDCLEHIHGMFAFAIWDRTRRRLVLARDRLGIKPLFYAITDQGLVFGSEIKAVLAAGVSRQIDTVAFDQYFSHFCVPTPHTMFRGIRRLPPGHALVSEDGQVRIFEYWDLAYSPKPFAGDEREYVEGVAHHLRNAVRSHLQSDVPVGAFLSGGLDSGAVVAEMASLTDAPVHTFTVGFPHASYDERGAAAEIAGRFGTHHTAVTVDVDWRDILGATVKWFDEPFGDYAAVPGFLASQVARQHVKVVLSGDGGDELLAGYPTHYAHRVARLYRRVPALVRSALIAPLVRALPTSMERVTFDYKAKRFVVGAELPFDEAHFHWKVIFTEAEKARLYSPAFVRAPEGEGFTVFEQYFRKVAHLDPLSQLLYVDAKTFLLDDNLTRVDRTSMAASLEVRVPFLDDHLVEYVRTIPTEAKQPGWGTKHLLREAMKGVLPADIVRGAKKGFSPPMAHWLRGELRPLMLDTLSRANLEAIGLFDAAYVADLIAQHLEGRRDNNRQIWALMSAVAWWHEYQPEL